MPVPAGRTVHAPNGMVCSVDHLASEAGVALLRAGGSAADAAIAASAVLAVTTQHMCGMGGDLFALVHDGSGAPAALAAAGRAGSGADAAALRAEGHRAIPSFGDVRAATVPGCVDGWLALHERFGRTPPRRGARPRRGVRARGVPCVTVARAERPARRRTSTAPTTTGPTAAYAPVTECDARGSRASCRMWPPATATRSTAVAFGEGLLELGDGLYLPDDLAVPLAEWVEPLHLTAWGHEVWTVPPPSQGYLTLAAAWIADGLDLPTDPDDARVGAPPRRSGPPGGLRPARGAPRGRRRPGPPAPRPLAAATSGHRPRGSRHPSDRHRPAATPSTCAPSTPRAWGCRSSSRTPPGGAATSWCPAPGVFLHNRGIGFSLEAGHPAELAPGRRPPHTLAPALVTRDGELHAVLGTMGGDTQPQVVLQLLARLLHAGQSPGTAIRSARWALGTGGFDVWEHDDPRPRSSGTHRRPGSVGWPTGATASSEHRRGPTSGTRT